MRHGPGTNRLDCGTDLVWTFSSFSSIVYDCNRILLIQFWGLLAFFMLGIFCFWPFGCNISCLKVILKCLQLYLHVRQAKANA